MLPQERLFFLRDQERPLAPASLHRVGVRPGDLSWGAGGGPGPACLEGAFQGVSLDRRGVFPSLTGSATESQRELGFQQETPLETYETVPVWKREPVRVLSLFGDIRTGE